MISVRQIGNCLAFGKRENPNQGRVYDTRGLCPTLSTMGGGGQVVQHIETSDRTFANAITSVQKDSMVCIIEDFYQSREPRVYTTYAPALRSERNGLKVKEEGAMRIRKLTPKECWRLIGFAGEEPMAFDDSAFERAEAVNSNTQLYKQAGNSIVVQCLELLLNQIIETGVWDAETEGM